jgi:Transposase
METLIERGCGLDVHKRTVAACVRVPGSKGTREQHVRTFGTMAAELVALREWLKTHGVTHVAMESTGVYWKPVWYVLEEAFTCLLVNAAHVKQVPGRKTDVLDCAWIAQLLEHGLLRGSFVPPAPGRGPLRFLSQELLRRQSRCSERNIGKVAVLDQRPGPYANEHLPCRRQLRARGAKVPGLGWRSRGAAVATLRAPGECSNLLG